MPTCCHLSIKKNVWATNQGKQNFIVIYWRTMKQWWCFWRTMHMHDHCTYVLSLSSLAMGNLLIARMEQSDVQTQPLCMCVRPLQPRNRQDCSWLGWRGLKVTCRRGLSNPSGESTPSGAECTNCTPLVAPLIPSMTWSQPPDVILLLRGCCFQYTYKQNAYIDIHRHTPI